MLNIYLKVREAAAYSKRRFSKFKMFVSKSVFGEHQLTHISFNGTLMQIWKSANTSSPCENSILKNLH